MANKYSVKVTLGEVIFEDVGRKIGLSSNVLERDG